MYWHRLKDPVVAAFGMSDDLLHVGLGAFAFLFFLFVLRNDAAPLRAWAAVLALEVVNEMGDAVDRIGWTRGIRWHETAMDVLLTMLLPTAMLIVFWASLRRSPLRRL